MINESKNAKKSPKKAENPPKKRLNNDNFLVFNAQELKKETVKKFILINTTMTDPQFNVQKIRQSNGDWRHEIREISVEREYQAPQKSQIAANKSDWAKKN
ncbi:hypothetical protein AYI68_g4270 [Smittium mucronatum]|uniref:Uncharacterized protein n=1 Tax=Smittium mucronatum TaxID=133383 RepID=A0A1R0GXJ5_9FUNG|nr:hypothetical protein AYI68_g4270 [Smittium mucronatum]